MICATSCADMIAIAIRCADYQFNHEPGRKNKARGLNYNSGFGSRLTLGITLPNSVIPKGQARDLAQAHGSHKLACGIIASLRGPSPRPTGVVCASRDDGWKELPDVVPARTPSNSIGIPKKGRNRFPPFTWWRGIEIGAARLLGELLNFRQCDRLACFLRQNDLWSWFR
jgi:hypothetical protein